MKTVIGKPISPGYAQGRAVVMGVGEAEVPERHITQNEINHEIARFQRALEESYRELQRLQDRVQAELGPSQADIFSAHLLFLRDRQFIDRVESCIKDDRLNVESAIKVTVTALARMLSEAENEYLRERAEDIKDLGRRLIRHITEFEARQLTRLSLETVLVARELLPSDLLELDRKYIVGAVTELGGETSHAAILARALGVPAVTGVPDATRIARPDMLILLDGQTGEVVFDPLPERVASSIANKENYDRVTSHVVSAEERECITQDGVKVHLYANIGRPCEVDQLIKHHLEGVGLFRTEYLFLDEPIAPSFERQRELYRQIAASLGKRPLVIRTLDLGGDKQPAFLVPQFEANPNLGIRGLRFSLLASQELFRTQIRALLHVGNDYDVRIMLPMVLGGADLRHAIAIMREVAEEEGIPELPPIGVLVETPAAVFAINEILAASDFVSVGTNDLTQFILAADRNALAMIDDYTVLHPSVLRAVRRVIETADGAAKPVSVCGEAAADPRVACLLVGLGVRRLSMSPVSTPRVRYALRASYLRTLKALADAALACDSAEAVSAMLTDTLKDTLPGPAPAGISV